MKTNYILVDFENVQPLTLFCPPDLPIKVMIFVGEKQQKISLDLAISIQGLGKEAEYIKISGQGQNALDFHLAYWIGRLAERDPNSIFHIISKDKGFDPLIIHLKSQKIVAQRVAQISDIQILNGHPKLSITERVTAVINSLKARGNSRPRRRTTLKNTIAAIFMKTLSDDELNKMVSVLQSKKFITIEGEVVTYNFSPVEALTVSEELVAAASLDCSLNEQKKNSPKVMVSPPENHGKQWTPKEDGQLIARFKSKLSIDEIAKKHKRGIGGVHNRLAKLGVIEPSTEQNSVDVKAGSKQINEDAKSSLKKPDVPPIDHVQKQNHADGSLKIELENSESLPEDFNPYVVDLNYPGKFGSEAIDRRSNKTNHVK